MQPVPQEHVIKGPVISVGIPKPFYFLLK